MPKSTNITNTHHAITAEEREQRYGHKPATVWFTGLSGSGKSTLAVALEERLFELGCMTFVFDGDNMRFGLSRDLGFSSKDRQENLRRVAEVAKIFNLAGGIAITSFITPFEESRELARKVIGDNYIEVYINVSLETCIARDPKGLYKRALAGEIPKFTGISSPYEEPQNPDMKVDTTANTVDEIIDSIVDYLRERGTLFA